MARGKKFRKYQVFSLFSQKNRWFEGRNETVADVSKFGVQFWVGLVGL